MRGWKGGRATLQYHLLDDGVAWGLRLELQFLRCKVYCSLFSLILLIFARYNELPLIQSPYYWGVRYSGGSLFGLSKGINHCTCSE